jgi:hypothetical protein
MADIKVTPIQQEHLDEVGQFLHETLNRKIAAAAWVASITHPWSEVRPNYGMQLRDGAKLVGVFCAIYSDQTIEGRSEKVCNPHSWCVLGDYRNHAIGLVLALVKQRGYHFTMLTPNPKVAEIFRQLGFKDLKREIAVFPNLPLPLAGGIRESRPAAISALLSPAVRRDYELHRDIPWLRFVAFGKPQDICLIAYKVDRWKRLPSARILHVSDRGAFARHLSLLRNHFALARGLATTSIETRFIEQAPRFAHRLQRTQAKLFRSTTLRDEHITDLYSELASLDI